MSGWTGVDRIAIVSGFGVGTIGLLRSVFKLNPAAAIGTDL